ncbi:MAG: outer-membrane lipoprotein carrier protein LolA [Chromatiales bacterium]|nr:outer-membrane lipoprotein carrier protein LolA [Chromatiales bacterium]
MRPYKISAAVLSCLFFFYASAVADIFSDLDIFFDAETFRANFEQKVYSADGQKIDESKGFILFHRPGRFRWEYVLPEPYLILTDGINLLIYDVPLKQAYIRPTLTTLGKAPLMLLLDKRTVADDFYVDTIADNTYAEIDAVDWLRLEPKEDDTDFIYFDVGFRNSRLSYLVLYDHFDQSTHIRFYDVQTGTEFKRDYFKIKLPEDVDVIQNGR